MNRKTVRRAILVLGLFTAIVHLIILPFIVWSPDWGASLRVAWLLNGIGYLVLLWATLSEPEFLEDSQDLVHYAFIGFAVLTIIAFFVFGQPTTDKLGWVTKLDEILLIAALVMDLRLQSKA
ncbi:MAG TPA: hypothetical protein VJ160_06125 [Anaerolineales bacterium]|nr:hypothetical protein [Anaerolineales bacterium]